MEALFIIWMIGCLGVMILAPVGAIIIIKKQRGRMDQEIRDCLTNYGCEPGDLCRYLKDKAEDRR